MEWNGFGHCIPKGDYIVGRHTDSKYIVLKENSNNGATISYFVKRENDNKKCFLKHYSSEIDKDFLKMQEELYKKLHDINTKDNCVEENFEYFEIYLKGYWHHFQVKKKYPRWERFDKFFV